MQATIYSKAVLRAVAGQLASEFDFIDYFPSFEIIMNPAARSNFYHDNLRSIRKDAVDYVMSAFFDQHAPVMLKSKPTTTAIPPAPIDERQLQEDETQCEEAMIEGSKK